MVGKLGDIVAKGERGAIFFMGVSSSDEVVKSIASAFAVAEEDAAVIVSAVEAIGFLATVTAVEKEVTGAEAVENASFLDSAKKDIVSPIVGLRLDFFLTASCLD